MSMLRRSEIDGQIARLSDCQIVTVDTPIFSTTHSHPSRSDIVYNPTLTLSILCKLTRETKLLQKLSATPQ